MDCSSGLDIEAVTRLVCTLPDVQNILGDQINEVRNASYPLEILATKIGTRFAILRQVDFFILPRLY
jgi:hypothetical protein